MKPWKMTRWKWLVTGMILVGVFYWALPWYYVGTTRFLPKNGEGNEEAARAHAEHLASFGDRAVPAILYSLKNNSPFRRRYVYLPYALERIGPSADWALLEAIDEESDPLARNFLIGALVMAFRDPSRLARWARDVQENNASQLEIWHMPRVVADAFTEAPPVLISDRDELSLAFLAWAEQRRR